MRGGPGELDGFHQMQGLCNFFILKVWPTLKRHKSMQTLPINLKLSCKFGRKLRWNFSFWERIWARSSCLALIVTNLKKPENNFQQHRARGAYSRSTSGDLARWLRETSGCYWLRGASKVLGKGSERGGTRSVVNNAGFENCKTTANTTMMNATELSWVNIGIFSNSTKKFRCLKSHKVT